MRKKSVVCIFNELNVTSAGSFRQERWMASILKEGFSCVLVDVSTPIMKIKRFESLEIFLEFRSSIRNLPTVNKSITEGEIGFFLRLIKHFFLLEVLSPINLVHSIKLLRLIKKEEATIIFSSTPAFSTVLLGSICKKFNKKIKFIADFRDEWAKNPFLPTHSFINRRYIERVLLKECSYVFVSTSYMKDKMIKNKVPNIKIIYNTFQLKEFEHNEEFLNIPLKINNVEIVYTGSIPEHFYDLNKLVVFLRDSWVTFGNSIVFKFIGQNNDLKKYVLPENVLLLDKIPHSEVIRIQNNADILLFVGAKYYSNGGIVTTKIFEYLRSKKYILPLFIEPESDIDIVLRNTCNKSLNINTSQELKNVLLDVINNKYSSLLCLRTNYLDEIYSSYDEYVKKYIV